MTSRSNKLKFRPGDTSYRWNDDSESPFLKRSVINFSYDAKTKAKLITLQRQYYELIFKNENEPFLSRNQAPPAKEVGPEKEARFLEEQDLIGNDRQIKFSLAKLIHKLIQNLEADPQTLFSEADKIERICDTVGLTIQPIETFNRLSNWEEFMDLLKSLEKKEYRFKFELLIAAITQYARRCS